MNSNLEEDFNKNNKKKYGFWKLLIISYLLIAFLPFSILFCVFFYGMNETIEIIKAVLRDILVTLLGIIARNYFLVDSFYNFIKYFLLDKMSEKILSEVIIESGFKAEWFNKDQTIARIDYTSGKACYIPFSLASKNF